MIQPAPFTTADATAPPGDSGVDGYWIACGMPRFQSDGVVVLLLPSVKVFNVPSAL
jgi:hypothetical protein